MSNVKCQMSNGPNARRRTSNTQRRFPPHSPHPEGARPYTHTKADGLDALAHPLAHPVPVGAAAGEGGAGRAHGAEDLDSGAGRRGPARAAGSPEGEG